MGLRERLRALIFPPPAPTTPEGYEARARDARLILREISRSRRWWHIGPLQGRLIAAHGGIPRLAGGAIEKVVLSPYANGAESTWTPSAGSAWECVNKGNVESPATTPFVSVAATPAKQAFLMGVSGAPYKMASGATLLHWEYGLYNKQGKAKQLSAFVTNGGLNSNLNELTGTTIKWNRTALLVPEGTTTIAKIVKNGENLELVLSTGFVNELRLYDAYVELEIEPSAVKAVEITPAAARSNSAASAVVSVVTALVLAAAKSKSSTTGQVSLKAVIKPGNKTALSFSGVEASVKIAASIVPAAAHSQSSASAAVKLRPALVLTAASASHASIAVTIRPPLALTARSSSAASAGVAVTTAIKPANKTALSFSGLEAKVTVVGKLAPNAARSNSAASGPVTLRTALVLAAARSSSAAAARVALRTPLVLAAARSSSTASAAMTLRTQIKPANKTALSFSGVEAAVASGSAGPTPVSLVLSPARSSSSAALGAAVRATIKPGNKTALSFSGVELALTAPVALPPIFGSGGSSTATVPGAGGASGGSAQGGASSAYRGGQGGASAGTAGAGGSLPPMYGTGGSR